MSVRGESDSPVIQREICDSLPDAERQGYLAEQSFGLVTLWDHSLTTALERWPETER